MLKMNYFLIIFLLIIVAFQSNDAKLNEFFRWNHMTYADLPDYVLQNIPADTNLATIVNETSYIPYNNLPIGVTHWNRKLFISVARRNYGVPSTLNVIDIDLVPQGDQSPSLYGYPNYEVNAIPAGLQRNPDRIISVYRTRADACNRLWFVDTGFIEYPGARQQVQRPAIWVIDLLTNERVRRFEIPESVAVLGDGFISITVDVDANACNKAFAYLPNLRTYTVSVYSFETNNLWTFGHNYFYLEPMSGDFNINGIKFRWSDGPFSVAIGPKNPDGYRNAYIHAFASVSEYVVSTQVLQNASLASRSYQGDEFQYLGNRGENMQSAMHDIDEQSGIMIFSANHKNAVGCWNLRNRFRQPFIDEVDRNDVTMVYPSDLKVSREGIWMLTNQIPVFVYSRLSETDYNYRIWHNSVHNAIRNTKCGTTGTQY